MKNIILIGMPYCGKTTIGKALAAALGMELIDTDVLIEHNAGMKIPDIFKDGEAAFRKLEREAIAQVAPLKGKVISTGGGVVLDENNINLLQQNGVIFFIDRPLEMLLSAPSYLDRPLVKTAEQLQKLYDERINLYQKHSNIITQNNGEIAKAVTSIVDCYTSLRSKTLCVIGDPIAHSLSPNINQPVLNCLSLDSSYEKILVAPEELASFFAKAKERFDGYNVTMPHKTKIIPFIDVVDSQAAVYNAVNTVVVRDGVTYGYNTDAEGFNQSLISAGRRFKDANVAILGCGGAGGTLALKAVFEGAKAVTIFQNNAQKSDSIIKKANELNRQTTITRHPFDSQAIEKACGNVDILINATPLGMEGVSEDFESLEFISALPKTSLVCDLIYRPQQTRLLKHAKACGIVAVGGLEMLIYQGILAEEYFFGIQINKQNMYRRILYDTAFKERI